jgi:hypothetical protein
MIDTRTYSERFELFSICMQSMEIEPKDVTTQSADTMAAWSECTISIDQLRSLTEMLHKELSAAKARIAELELVVHPKRKKEKYYQRILENRLGAKHLRVPGVGETDLTTDDSHIELKKWSDYDDVPGQLAKYNLIIPRPRRCGYFFGPLPGRKRIAFIEALMKSFGIEMYSFDADDDIHRHDLDVKTAIISEVDAVPVEVFIKTRLVRVDDQNTLLSWMDVKRAFRLEYHRDPPHDPSRKEKPWHYFVKNGLTYVDTCLAVCGGKKFRGFRGWQFNEADTC